LHSDPHELNDQPSLQQFENTWSFKLEKSVFLFFLYTYKELFMHVNVA